MDEIFVDMGAGIPFVAVVTAVNIFHINESSDKSEQHNGDQETEKALIGFRWKHSTRENITHHVDERSVNDRMNHNRCDKRE